MKLFFVDKYNELRNCIKELKNYDIENIERKEDCKFKMTKNDFVVFCDDNDFDGAEKLKNIIMISKQKEKKNIWNIVNNYKTIDVIDFEMPVEYICRRIERLVK